MFSIIIVNYLQKDFLLRCIASIYENLPKDSFEVIIVNNSPEDNLSEISAKFPSVKIITNENTGYSKANNLAAKQANGEYLLFLNADTEILSDFTGGLLAEFGNRKFGGIGLGLQFPGGSFQNSFGLFPSILNEYKNRKVEIAFKEKNTAVISNRQEEYSKIREVDWVTGAALVIRKKVFEEIGGFDERFFLFYEDIDLCYRLHNAGYTNYYYPYAEITHHKGENTRTELKSENKRVQTESQAFYYKLHTSIIQQLLLKIYQIFFSTSPK